MNAALLIMGVVLLPVLYHVAFPIRLPKLENYFAPGQSFHSEAEGITMNILRQEGTRVHCEFRFSPGAGCQLQHRHEHFDQSGTVTKGTLVLRADKQLLRISAGGRVHVPRGTPHLMSNRGTGEVLLRCEGEEDALPVSYAYGLAKRYPLNRSKSLIRALDGRPNLGSAQSKPRRQLQSQETLPVITPLVDPSSDLYEDQGSGNTFRDRLNAIDMR